MKRSEKEKFIRSAYKKGITGRAEAMVTGIEKKTKALWVAWLAVRSTFGFGWGLGWEFANWSFSIQRE